MRLNTRRHGLLSYSAPNAIWAAYNHAEYAEQRRRMMQDWANRLDLLEQEQVEEAIRHLVVHLESIPKNPPTPRHMPQQRF
jgi:hypothetical protein